MIRRFRFRLKPELARVRALRQEVRTRLEALGVAERHVDTTVLVLDEMISNSIEHGAAYRSADDELIVRIELCGDGIRLEFIDPSVPAATVRELETVLSSLREGVPPAHFERGRGLFLIQEGVADMKIEASPDGRGLRLTGRIALESA